MISRSIRVVLVAASSLLLAAKSDGCNADKSIGGNDPEVTPVACGEASCDPGLVCCDEACGACAPDAAECPENPCEVAVPCGTTTCGEGEACCSDTCCIDAAAVCSPESCVAETCGEATCEAGTQFCCMAEGCTRCLANGTTCSSQSCE